MGKFIKYWPLIIGILSLVGGYAILGRDVSAHIQEDTQKDHFYEMKINQHEVEIAVLKEGMGNINKNLEKIVVALDRMKR